MAEWHGSFDRLEQEDREERQALLAEWQAFRPAERWKIFTLGCGIFATLTALGVAAGRTMPVQVTEEVVKVEKVQRIVVPVPPRREYQPLADPKTACSGVPVVIEQMDVSGTMADEDATTTWFAVRPAGDDYTVQCNMGGDYSGTWNVGDLVVLNGKLTG